MWYFVSKYKNYSLQVTIEGVKQTINFRDIGNYPEAFANGGIFSTEDEDVANAIISLSICAEENEPSNAADGFPPGKEILYCQDDHPQEIWGGPPSNANEVLNDGEFKVIDQLNLEAPNAPKEGTLVDGQGVLYFIREGVAEEILTSVSLGLRSKFNCSKSKIVTLAAGTHADLNSLLFPNGILPAFNYGLAIIGLVYVHSASSSGTLTLSWKGSEFCNNSINIGNSYFFPPSKQVGILSLSSGVFSAVCSVNCQIQLIVHYYNLNIMPD